MGIQKTEESVLATTSAPMFCDFEGEQQLVFRVVTIKLQHCDAPFFAFSNPIL